jgi:hypothetical protein
MQVKQVILILLEAGVQPIYWDECTEWQDGEIYITPTLSLQIPTQGRKMYVWEMQDNGMYELTNYLTFAGLISKIRKSLGLVAA